VDLASSQTVKHLLAKYRIRPNKKLGQHFAVDKNLIDALTDLANPSKKDIILEVGAGLGAITKKLSRRTGKIIAVEKDPRLCKALKETLNGLTNVKIVRQDILETSLKNLPKPYKIIANLPFQITSPFLKKFLQDALNKPQVLVLGLQKEVARRLTAQPPQMNHLALFTQSLTEVSVGKTFPARAFYPRPEVAATLVKITPKKILPDRQILIDKMLKNSQTAFNQKRKKLINSLISSFSQKTIKACLKHLKLPENSRPQELNLDQWLKLTQCLK
jgi:16S rRNA (adenine1518-N6/adenine1519-N6)-dimethyltransferase